MGIPIPSPRNETLRTPSDVLSCEGWEGLPTRSAPSTDSLYSQLINAALPAGISHSAVPFLTATCSTRPGLDEPSAPTGDPAKVVFCSSSNPGAISRSIETRSP